MAIFNNYVSWAIICTPGAQGQIGAGDMLVFGYLEDGRLSPEAGRLHCDATR